MVGQYEGPWTNKTRPYALAERQTSVRTAERPTVVLLATAGRESRKYCTPRMGTRPMTRRKTRIGSLADSGGKKREAAMCSDGLRGPRVAGQLVVHGAEKTAQGKTNSRRTSLLADGDTW